MLDTLGLFDGTALERPVLCDRCGVDVKDCQCEPIVEVPAELEPAKQRLKIRVEKRKRGKVMTVVSGFEGSQNQRQEVLKALKTDCGAGGTVAETSVEIQGDHQSRVRNKLEQLGFKIQK